MIAETMPALEKASLLVGYKGFLSSQPDGRVYFTDGDENLKFNMKNGIPETAEADLQEYNGRKLTLTIENMNLKCKDLSKIRKLMQIQSVRCVNLLLCTIKADYVTNFFPGKLQKIRISNLKGNHKELTADLKLNMSKMSDLEELEVMGDGEGEFWQKDLYIPPNLKRLQMSIDTSNKLSPKNGTEFRFEGGAIFKTEIKVLSAVLRRIEDVQNSLGN
jgi:hypothetical protein